MKKFIRFVDSFTRKAEYYKLDDEQKYYRSFADSNLVFSVDKVQKYPHQFMLGDSVEEIKREIQIANFNAIYGNGTEGNATCSNCGRYFKIPEFVEHCYDGSECLNDKEEIKCLCGTVNKFEAVVKFIRVK